MRAEDSMKCSFCSKTQGAVGKLIASTSDYPRAYICDECVAICSAIIEDDRPEVETTAAGPDLAAEPHPLLNHPLASEFLTSVEHWIRSESLGGDGAKEFAEMRRIAGQMMG